MTSASVVTSSDVIQCLLPATFETAIAAVRQALPEERWDNVLLSCGVHQVEPGKALDNSTYALVSYDALGTSAVSIAKTEHCGITMQQLLQIEKFIQKHVRFWVEAFRQSPSFGLPLEFEKFNLHHACHWIISPATRKLCCSLVELVATDADAQYPWWFVSHAWQEAIFKFVACLRQHAALRNVADGAYWVCAYANNQHRLKEEICANPRSTSFYRAMQLSIGIVLILDEKATPFTRIWCCFEESIAVEERNAGMPLLLDVAATDPANEAHVLTDGLAAAEASRMPLLGFLAKSVREAAFPTPLVQKGLDVDIAQADASLASDKTAILNSIRLPRARTKVLSDSAPLEDPNYTAVNQALAAHFALASWFGFVAKRHSFDSKVLERLLSALAADSFRRVVQLSFTGCRGFTDAELSQLLRHLPRQLLLLRLDMGFSGVQCWAFPEVEEMEMPPLQELSLRFTGSHLANASGLGQMLGAEPMSQSLRSVQLWFSNLPSLVELGSWEPLTKLKLEELVLQLNACEAVTDEAKQSLYDCVQRLKRRQRGLELRLTIEGVAERSWPWVPCQRPAVKDVELAGGKSVDELENFGSETLPFPCSYGGCDIFHSNLSGFCPKHRMWRHCWKLGRVWQTAWCWTELSLLFAIQAAAEIEHRATLVAILLSLYPVFCLSLEESVGIPWAITCALLLVAVICSLVTTSVRFDNMREQILKQSVATEASYSQVLQLPDSGNMLRVPTMAGCSYPDSSVLHQRSTDLSRIYRDAQSRLPLFQRAMKLVLPNATVKIKLLTHLSNEEQQSPEKVLDALRCELVCEDMLGVQEAFKGLEDRIQSEDLASLQIAAVQDTFAEMSGHKCCQVILQMENYFASVFLMDAFLTRMDNELSSVTKLAAQFGLLDDMKSKWETSSRLWNSVSDVRRPLVLVGTIFLQVLALAMSMFMALQYFLRYAHRIRPQLPDLVLDGLLLDRGEESGETILEAIFLALPYLVLVAVFLQQLVCRKQRRKRPQPTKILYERYFGLRGAYYPVKVAILQGLTVMVQAFGKISLLGGLVTFAQEEQDATAILWLSVGFWAFFALLCWNSLYPAFLLMFPDTAWARIGAAFTDAALDLGYILTYLGMVLVAMLRLRTASEGWGNFGEDLTLQFSNRISPVFAFPTDLLGYCAVYFNLAHACCIAHILQHTTWRLPVRPRGERQKSRCLPRLFGCSLSIGLLSMLMTLLVTQEVFPMTHGRDFTCFPCNCAKNVGSAGQQISSCNLAVVLRQTQVNLAAKNITAVDPKAFSKLGHVQRLSLANNSLIHLPPGLFEGLSSLEQLDLTRVKLETMHGDSLRGLKHLKLLAMSENQLTELSAAMLRHLPLLEQLLLGGKRSEDGTRLISAGNFITELGAIFGHNEQLQVIDFSSNWLRKIHPGTFAGLKKLRWLSLGLNFLTTIPAGAFQGLEQLQTLYLAGNQLTTIPAETFQGLEQLQELNLNNNQLTTIPARTFQGLGQLQTLDLRGNELTTIPAGTFQGLGQLQTLDLGVNWLKTIPAGTFQGLEQLQTLYLAGNQLTTIPAETFQGLEQLQELYLNDNQLTTIPAGTFQGLEQLEILSLEYNQLTTIPAGIFQGLEQLQKLVLYRNQLTTMPAGTFQGLEQLQTLDLSSNRLTTMPAGTFQGLEQLQTLDLYGNPWNSSSVCINSSSLPLLNDLWGVSFC